MKFKCDNPFKNPENPVMYNLENKLGWLYKYVRNTFNIYLSLILIWLISLTTYVVLR